jgi:hypothetical protein
MYMDDLPFTKAFSIHYYVQALIWDPELSNFRKVVVLIAIRYH